MYLVQPISIAAAEMQGTWVSICKSACASQGKIGKFLSLTYTALGHLSRDGARGDWRAGLRARRGEGHGGGESDEDGDVLHFGGILGLELGKCAIFVGVNNTGVLYSVISPLRLPNSQTSVSRVLIKSAFPQRMSVGNHALDMTAILPVKVNRGR